MLVLAIGFAGVSVKEGILAVCSTEGESAGESSSCTRARDLVMDAGWLGVVLGVASVRRDIVGW
ncbi:MAG: hypothetical protein OXR73_32410, partial [Myxococcales bacterium]|nr:hypothetical protein [Myxococcales bacterium]